VLPARRPRLRGLTWRKAARAALLLTVVFYGAYRTVWFVLYAEALTITRIEVHGYRRMSPGEVLALLEGLRGTNMATVDLESWRPAPSAGNARLKVVHAPSHRGVKGTRHLVEAVERLKRTGVAIDLVLVEGLSRSEARAVYERCDVAVDQLLAGWYGGFAVEAMALGKPVVAYLRQADLAFIPGAMRAELPVVSAEPGSIEAVLRSLAESSHQKLAEIGARGRAYVERWHHPGQIAASVIADYRVALGR